MAVHGPQTQKGRFLFLGWVEVHSEVSMHREVDGRISVDSAVLLTLYWSVVVKKELICKLKLSVYRLVFVPTLTYVHKLWVVTQNILYILFSG